jgi:hypothetical protein
MSNPARQIVPLNSPDFFDIGLCLAALPTVHAAAVFSSKDTVLHEHFNRLRDL